MHKIIDIERKTDERGWLAEVLKADFLMNNDFGQFFITTAKPGISKGDHYHKRKHEYFIVIRGSGLFTLEDISPRTKEVIKSEEIELDSKDLKCIEILPWTNHRILNTSDDEMWLLVYVDEEYDPENPDTFRFISEK